MEVTINATRSIANTLVKSKEILEQRQKELTDEIIKLDFIKEETSEIQKQVAMLDIDIVVTKA
jgi:hypothetical protein